jgi:hypothetical protein
MMKDFEPQGPVGQLFERFNYLRDLPEGWDEGAIAETVDEGAINTAWELAVYAWDTKAEMPGVFPMEDGGVLVEWSSPTAVTNIEIQPGGTVMSLFDLHPASHDKITTLEDSTLEQAKAFIDVALES